LGYKRKDELNRINGREIKLQEIQQIISDFYDNVREGDKISIEVLRPKKIFKSKYKTVTLTAIAKKVKVTRQNKMSVMENATQKQKNTLMSWVGYGDE